MNCRLFSRYSLSKYFILVGLLTGLVLSACSATSSEIEEIESPAPSAIIEKEPDPSPTVEDNENIYGNWLEYRNENFGFRFLYPATWFGPEVYESEGTLRIEIGSDQVYPYGTDRTERITTIPDSYYITIQYFDNIESRTWDDFINSGWITTYQTLRDLQDGESVTTVRSLTTRVREVTLGDFQGLEYIATLSNTAQTERVYIREIMAFDKDLNWLRISGSPNLVEITGPENWKEDYNRVDKDNLESFILLTESIMIK